MFHQMLAAIDDSPSTPVTLGSPAAPAHGDDAAVHVLQAKRSWSGGRGIDEIAHTGADRLVEGR
jgi:hypothetical protein